ncbi:MAG: zinc-binding dehydrogenase [Desulfobacterales bacterium]|nr:zinc-binding dehydrogenase [Desulfobacterales bacterium]MDX2512291.1 zinc-binding dehydrogenase [Desulfobacterales bacterium]
MKAVRLIETGKPLQEQEIPIPSVGDHDVLVRVKAAGICHSDVHYRAGKSAVGVLPQTLGHEVAGVIEKVGSGVENARIGERVSLHYLLTCGNCDYCRQGREQFCVTGSMIGKHRDGGYAEYITVPARNAVPLPDAVSFEQGAVLMCSTSTSFHALRKARLRAGESVAVFGAGGLGMSAIQLAFTMGASAVFAIDISPQKLATAETYGAIPVDASICDPVKTLLQKTAGKGIDVSLEVIGLPETMQQAVRCLGVFGRAALAGIADSPFEIDSYQELLGRETQIIGCSDHLLEELPILLEFLRQGRIDLSHVITESVSLDADAINDVLDKLEQFKGHVRSVIKPTQ